MEQQTRNLVVKTLKQEVATRFTATTTMIRSFLNDPNEKKDEQIDVEKCKENINAINSAMESSLSTADFAKMEILESDINVALTILPTLDIIGEGIDLLGGEKFATGSIVLPFVAKFLKLMVSDEEDPIYFRKFKDTIKDDLSLRCASNLNTAILSKCSFFDPRYKKMKFFEDLAEFNIIQADVTKLIIMEEIRDELESIYLETTPDITLQSSQNKKRKRFLDEE